MSLRVVQQEHKNTNRKTPQIKKSQTGDDYIFIQKLLFI